MEKPYSCDKCGQSFKYKHHWSQHVNRLLPCGADESKCTICGANFSSRHNMRKHIKTCVKPIAAVDLELRKEVEDLKRSLAAILQMQVKTEMAIVDAVKNKVTNNNSNNVTNNTVNNTIVNQQITINCFDSPKIGYLMNNGDATRGLMVYAGNNLPITLIDIIWFNSARPENQSVKLGNTPDLCEVMIDRKWETRSLNEVAPVMREVSYEAATAITDINQFMQLHRDRIERWKRDKHDTTKIPDEINSIKEKIARGIIDPLVEINAALANKK